MSPFELWLESLSGFELFYIIMTILGIICGSVMLIELGLKTLRNKVVKIYFPKIDNLIGWLHGEKL